MTTRVLHDSWTEVLARTPETGMGYQVLEVQARHEPAYVVVLNGKLVDELPREPFLVREGLEQPDGRIPRVLVGPVEHATFRVLSRAEAVGARVFEAMAVGAGPASDAPVEDSEDGERFLRFSAYEDDIRVRPDGSVTPGTYVTTREDGMAYVRTGVDAVRRYALPNPEPAVHRFHLAPPEPIPVRRGTVQPAFGQPGGGVEVIFKDGAPAGTKETQDRIPPR